jgi:hypothetical protein
MRLLFGIVLGAVLTIGAAYYHDSTYAQSSIGGPARTLVNWDVAGGVANDLTRSIRSGIARLIGGGS